MKPLFCILSLFTLFTPPPICSQSTEYEDVEIEIPLGALNGISSASQLEVEIPACKYDKTFALTLVGDDALMGIYQRAFNYVYGRYVDDDPIFHEEKEKSTTGITPSRKLVYTDGCGNDIPFRLGSNWLTGKEGQNLHEDGNVYLPQMWWSEGRRFTDYYNGVMNHGGGDQTKPRESILKNQQEIVENIGLHPFVLGVPGATTGFPEATEEIPDIYFMEAGSFPGEYPRLKDVTGNLLKKRFARICIDSKKAGELGTMVSEKASDSRWINFFCHEIKNSDVNVNGQFNAAECFAFFG